MIPLVIWNRQTQNAASAEPGRDDAEAVAQLQPEIGAVALGLMQAIPDPFVVIDATGHVRAANAAAQELFRNPVIGNHLSEHVRAPAVLETIAEVVETGNAQHVEFERRVGGGRRFEAWIAPVADDGSSHKHSVAAAILLKDLTAQEHLKRMRTNFVANASHELRTPLASVTGLIETLQGPARDDPAAREKFLARMLEQAHRMRRLIDDLLSLSRVEMNVHRTPVDAVDIGGIVRYVAETLGPLAREEACDIHIDAPTGIKVMGERDELIIVVQNLLENALKYGTSDRGIELSVSEDAARGAVSLSVRDYGMGIEKEHLPRLTERFYRVDARQSRQRGGTGLGLAIVKHILLRHRAELDIESAIGSGSVFTIRFPVPDHVQDVEK